RDVDTGAGVSHFGLDECRLEAAWNLERDVDRVLPHIRLEVRRWRDRLVGDQTRIGQRMNEVAGCGTHVQVLYGERDLGRSGRAEDRAEQENEDDGEGEGEERPDARAEILSTERRDVGQDPLHAARTPSSIRAPTSLRKTSSSVERFV